MDYGLGGGLKQGYAPIATQGYAPTAIEKASYDQPVAPAAGALASSLNESQKALAVLSQEIGELEMRLTPFMHPSAPEPNQGASTTRPTGSPLAEAVAGINVELFKAAARVRSLLSRLDA